MEAGHRRAMLAVIGSYLAVSTIHGLTHFAVPVGLTAFQWVFVLVVAAAAPVTALWLVRRGRESFGIRVYAAAMIGGFLFGLYFHFLVPNPDNVEAVHGPFGDPFAITAVLIALTSFVGAIHGLWLWRRRSPTDRSGVATAEG